MGMGLFARPVTNFETHPFWETEEPISFLYQFAQNRQIHPVKLPLLILGGFQEFGNSSQPFVIHKKPKTSLANLPLPDVGVPVHPGAEILDRIEIGRAHV